MNARFVIKPNFTNQQAGRSSAADEIHSKPEHMQMQSELVTELVTHVGAKRTCYKT